MGIYVCLRKHGEMTVAETTQLLRQGGLVYNRVQSFAEGELYSMYFVLYSTVATLMSTNWEKSRNWKTDGRSQEHETPAGKGGIHRARRAP
jgi:hypothetical protein